jgi:hypothetical protein
MTFHVKSGLYNPTGILCAFFCLLSHVGSVVGQPIEPTVIQIPASPNNLDSVIHYLYVGSPSELLEDVYAIEAVYTYSGYQIHANTNTSLHDGDSSWFNNDGLGEGTIIVVIEDIGKRNGASLQLEKIRWKSASQVKMLSLKAGSYLEWSKPVLKFEVMAIDGRMLKQGESRDGGFSACGFIRLLFVL